MGRVVCGTDKEIKLAAKEGCDGRRRKMKAKPLLNNPVNWIKPISDRCYPVRESRAWARVVLFSRWHFQGSGRDNCIIQGMTPGPQQPCDQSRRSGWQNSLRTEHKLRSTPNFPTWLIPWHQHSGSRTGGCLLLLRGYFSFSFWLLRFIATGQKVVHRVLQQKRGCNTQTFRLKCSLLITC